MSKVDPPTEEEIKLLEHRATQPAARVPLTVIPSTGLYPSEFFHLRKDWITWPMEMNSQEYPIITVPLSGECTRKTKLRGRRKATVGIVREDEPCSICRKKGKTNFQSPSRLEAERNVPVIDNTAADELRLWFQKYNTIPWNRNLTRLQTVSEDLINRTVKASDLRFVFARRAVKMGISDELIAENMGLKHKPKWLLEYNRKNSPEKVGKLTYQQYLEVIYRNGPITVCGISNLISRSESAVRSMLKKLEKRGFATRVGQKGRGRQTKNLWDTDVCPNTPLTCSENRCGEKFDTFVGLTAHRTRAH